MTSISRGEERRGDMYRWIQMVSTAWNLTGHRELLIECVRCWNDMVTTELQEIWRWYEGKLWKKTGQFGLLDLLWESQLKCWQTEVERNNYLKWVWWCTVYQAFSCAWSHFIHHQLSEVNKCKEALWPKLWPISVGNQKGTYQRWTPKWGR